MPISTILGMSVLRDNSMTVRDLMDKNLFKVENTGDNLDATNTLLTGFSVK